jgi:hypothetical protein
MGWSRRNSPVRAAEAAARLAALDHIGYRGRVNGDGEPLNGRGIAPRIFSAGLGHEDEVLDRDEVRDLAIDKAEISGGFACAEGDGLDDPTVAWPRGYRWDRGDR